MTVYRVFEIDYTRREALEQDYQLAKAHYTQVCNQRAPSYADHRERFRDAQERVERAREAYLKVLLRG